MVPVFHRFLLSGQQLDDMVQEGRLVCICRAYPSSDHIWEVGVGNVGVDLVAAYIPVVGVLPHVKARKRYLGRLLRPASDPFGIAIQTRCIDHPSKPRQV